MNAKDNTVQSAYLISTSEGYLELLNLTLKNGADVDSKDSFNGTGLIRAADRGHADIAGRLVEAGVKINHINNLGWTALHEAIILGDASGRYVDTVRVLVAAGADLRLPSQRDKISPIEHATAKGFTEITQVLRTALEADKPPKERADRRLLAAAERGDPTAAALAVRAGADLETADTTGRTPLSLAITEDQLAVARLLVYLGADPDHVNNLGWTALLEAVILGDGSKRYQQIVTILLDAGADPQIADQDGVTPLHHAMRRGHSEVASILKNA